MSHCLQTARRLIVGCAAAAAAAMPAAAAENAADKPAVPTVAVENIPAVPVRLLRPDAEPRKVDAVTRAVPASPDRIDRALSPIDRSEAEGPGYRMNENHTIRMRPGENIFIPIAVGHPNRILTPFRNPQVVSTTLSSGSKQGECGEICVRDSVVYISTDKTFPVTAFITESGREDIALSVTMMPRQVPPREVKLMLPEDVMEALRFEDAAGTSAAKAAVWEASMPYVETVRSLFRTIALGSVPQGYNLRGAKPKDPLPVCKHPGLSFDFNKGQILEGYNLSVYVGVVRNMADSPVEFREQRCGGWRIAAVTSWPLKVLKPGQAAEVYIAVKRIEEQPASTVRKPLIPREYN